MEQTRERFAGLDLMRGFAALAVLSLHIPHPPGTGPLLPRAYLAVDFFFALSGFVLAHAYGERLRRDIGPAHFLRIRLKRLYPLYLIALAAGAILVLGDVLEGADPAHFLVEWGGALAANFLFLPAPPQVSGPDGLLFPAVGAAWSLFWELAANLVYALLARFAPKAVPLISPLALFVLAMIAGHPTLDQGAHWGGFAIGGLRVCWAFFLGVTMHTLVRPRATRHSHSGLLGWGAALLMILLFAADPPSDLIGIYDLGFITFIVPLLIVLGARARLNGRSARFAGWLGGISYAVYVLQSPVLKMLGTLTSVAGLPIAGMQIIWASAICVGITVLIAQLVQDQIALRLDKPVYPRAISPGPLTTISRVWR